MPCAVKWVAPALKRETKQGALEVHLLATGRLFPVDRPTRLCFSCCDCVFGRSPKLIHRYAPRRGRPRTPACRTRFDVVRPHLSVLLHAYNVTGWSRRRFAWTFCPSSWPWVPGLFSAVCCRERWCLRPARPLRLAWGSSWRGRSFALRLRSRCDGNAAGQRFFVPVNHLVKISPQADRLYMWERKPKARSPRRRCLALDGSFTFNRTQ